MRTGGKNLWVLVALVGACKSDPVTTASPDSGTTLPCTQQDGYCRCASFDAGGTSIAECTPESQGAGSACCEDDSGCACFAQWNIVCARDILCRCGPDIYERRGERVDKCVPANEDGGPTERCCKRADDNPFGPDCFCTNAQCGADEVEVAECLPRILPRKCDGAERTVDTCAKK